MGVVLMGYSFITAAAKHLSMVEIDSWSSNQHEFNGVSSLKYMFGTKKQYFEATFIYYSDVGEEVQEYGQVTWYDARETNPMRTEHRLYYTDNSIVKKANINDLLVVGKKSNNSVVIIIVKNGCSYYNLFMDLFGLTCISNSYVIYDKIAM